MSNEKRVERVVIAGSLGVIVLVCFVFACIRGVLGRRNPAPAPTGARTETVDVPARNTCETRSQGRGTNTLESRRNEATQVTLRMERLRMRHATAESVGVGWTTLRVAGVVSCDNLTLQRIFDGHDSEASVSVELMCGAEGFVSIECETGSGERRTVALDSICDCEARGFLGGWCACSFTRDR